ncbi:MAG: protein-L-isoaspartate O-methyltransferase [Pseudomonadota bacterium]
MIDYEAARRQMVDCQIRTCDVTDHSILSSFLSVPREEFVPEQFRALAYTDAIIDLSALQARAEETRVMHPVAGLARMLEVACVEPTDVVLLIGAASGYSTAVVSQLASSVFALEVDDRLTKIAEASLQTAGCDNAMVFSSSLENGLPKEAPYDVIIVEGNVEKIPNKLVDQLSDGGRLVACIGTGGSAELTSYVNENGIVGSLVHGNCSMAPISADGFKNSEKFVF